MRGTFANVRLRNELVPGSEGTVTVHLPSGEETSIYDAALRYVAEGTPLVVVAGAEYGSGSSRDWAAKGTSLLGVHAVIATSFERIHRSNLVGLGVLPLELTGDDTPESLGLNGRETFAIAGLENGEAREVTVVAQAEDGASSIEFTARVRIDTPREIEYVRHGGILPTCSADSSTSSEEPQSGRVSWPCAGVAELVDALDSKSSEVRPRAGSSPASGTI